MHLSKQVTQPGSHHPHGNRCQVSLLHLWFVRHTKIAQGAGIPCEGPHLHRVATGWKVRAAERGVCGQLLFPQGPCQENRKKGGERKWYSWGLKAHQGTNFQQAWLSNQHNLQCCQLLRSCPLGSRKRIPGTSPELRHCAHFLYTLHPGIGLSP